MYVRMPLVMLIGVAAIGAAAFMSSADTTAADDVFVSETSAIRAAKDDAPIFRFAAIADVQVGQHALLEMFL